MKDDKFISMTDEELVKKAKLATVATATLGGAMAVLFVINIFLAFKKGFNSLSIIPVALLPILILNISSVKALKKELKARNLS